MGRIPRRELIDESSVGTYHCVQRCVRRAFLCGVDPQTQQSFDHRKEWIRRRLEILAGQFGIDILGFAVMSNHLHVVLRNRPDVVENWSDEEVARRWWNLFPQRREADGSPAEPFDFELKLIVANEEKLAEIRRRLSSISWLMRCLAEPIARQANKEDRCTGRFWEGRYKCQQLLDEAAVLACSIYVDLNPIRAGVADTPETSEFTSAYQRIHARQARRQSSARGANAHSAASGANRAGRQRTTNQSIRDQNTSKQHAEPSSVGYWGDAWLSPIHLDERPQVRDVQEVTQLPRRRASHKGFLSLKFEHYLELLDWTGRQARVGKQGVIPTRLAPILDRLEVVEDTWLEMVLNFGRWFHRAVGQPKNLEAAAGDKQQNWLAGIRHARQAFG